MEPRNRTYTTAIVVIPPQESWVAIQAIRQQHDRKVRRWMPHITLIYPFCPLDEFPAMREPLAASVVGQPPFDVTLADFKTFRHRRENYTVWLRPEPEEPLIALHDAFSSVYLGARSSSRETQFQPHLSVGQVQGKEQMNRLIEELRAVWKPLTFKIDHVSLIGRRDPPDDVFRVADEILLNRTST